MQISTWPGDLIRAIFNGAPTPDAAKTYTAQLTALISIYICFVALFLIGVHVRGLKSRPESLEPGRTFRIWIAYSLIFSILAIVVHLILFYGSVG